MLDVSRARQSPAAIQSIIRAVPVHMQRITLLSPLHPPPSPPILPLTQRAANELDEEALKLTREVLVENPDIATMWNYRREIISPGLTAL